MAATQSYKVVGMSCDHCIRAVTDEVSHLAGVTKVEVDLRSGALEIVTDEPVDPAAVAAAVEEAGYEVTR